MPRRRLLTALGATTLVVLAGCSSPTDPASEDGALKISSCGEKLSFSGTPERVVTMDQSTTENLLELGVQDRMIGTSNLKTKIAPEYKAAYDKIKVLSPDVLTAEQLREAAPDLAVSPFVSHFTPDRVGTREELHELGLQSYVSAVDCPKDNDPEANPFDRMFTDFENYGEIFGVEKAAGKLIEEQKEVLDTARDTGEELKDKPSVVWIYSVYDGKPYVAGKNSMPAEMSRLSGVDNIFDDVDEVWPEVTWEDVAERDPDIVVVGDLSERGQTGDSAEEKLDMMREDPAVSELTAVKKDRIIEVPGIEMDPSVRTVNTLQRFLDGLTDLGYAG
ncbi:MAG: ABC transporter substrate-binding protein [Stackebrandtia sp.]